MSNLRELKAEHHKEIQALRGLADKTGESVDKEIESRMAKAESLKAQIERREKIKALEQSQPPAEPWAKEKRSFSLKSAVDALTGRKALSGYEAEVSQEIERRQSFNSQGVRIPASALFGEPRRLEKRAVDNQTSLFSDPIKPEEMLPALRERSIMSRLGMRMISAVGRFSFPVTSGSEAGWFSGDGGSASGDSITMSDPTFTSIESRPKFLAVMSGWSLAQLKNMSEGLSIEGILRQDLSGAMAEALDDALIKGSGASNQPRGLINQTGITKTTKAHQATVAWTYDELLKEQEALAKDFKQQAMAPRWVTNPGVAREWRKTLRFSVNGASQLLTDGDMAAGWPCIITNFLNPASPASAAGDVEIIGGDFSQYMFVSYDAVSLELGQIDDDFRRGLTRLRAILCCDLVLRRSEGFRLLAIDRTA